MIQFDKFTETSITKCNGVTKNFTKIVKYYDPHERNFETIVIRNVNNKTNKSIIFYNGTIKSIHKK